MTTGAVQRSRALSARLRGPLRRIGYVAARLGLGVFVLWGTVTLVFVALQVLPGDPVEIIYGGENRPTPEQRAQITADFGLDKPVPLQYLTFVSTYLRGDLGMSYLQRRPVSEIIAAELRPTLELAAAASALAIVVALVLALSTAGRRRGFAHGLVEWFELVSISSPSFWIGILLLSLFSFQWRLFDVISDPGSLNALVLPAVTLALGVIGMLSQVLREGLEKALESPFVLSVRTRGVSEAALRLRHLLRHALLPAVTILGWFVGGILGGAVVTEAVFGRSGIGRITVQAIISKDIPVVIGVALLSALVFVLVNLIVDMLYPLIDPRLRRE